MFLIELITKEGRVAERYVTYEEARQRVEQFAAASLIGLPLIFQELADGSQRVVRDDGKPLQFHRVYAEDQPAEAEAAVPLAEPDPESLGPDGRVPVRDLRPAGSEWADVEWGEDIPFPDEPSEGEAEDAPDR